MGRDGASPRLVVAIDGPAGSGKSTVARGVANALGLHRLDTGAMYRAVTLAALDAGVDLADGSAVAGVARRVELDVDDDVVCLDGRDVADAIRGPEVTAAVSVVSAHPPVREILLGVQRAWLVAHGGGVVEGRDIGTVVAPDAPLKVFLTARDDERARRRQQDEVSAARAGSLEQVRDSLRRRDDADASLGRALRPDQAAPDAVIVDTTDVSAEAVIAEVVDRARRAQP